MNRLAQETSPYLLQHANNPVDWYPWGEEAFRKAKDENKLLIISIGYSACHWCHVMEHESLSNKRHLVYIQIWSLTTVTAINRLEDHAAYNESRDADYPLSLVEPSRATMRPG